MSNRSLWISNHAGGCTTMHDETSPIVLGEVQITGIIAVRRKPGWQIRGWWCHLFDQCATCLCWYVIEVSFPQLDMHHALSCALRTVLYDWNSQTMVYPVQSAFRLVRLGLSPVWSSPMPSLISLLLILDLRLPVLSPRELRKCENKHEQGHSCHTRRRRLEWPITWQIWIRMLSNNKW